jgi:hypothetical protein
MDYLSLLAELDSQPLILATESEEPELFVPKSKVDELRAKAEAVKIAMDHGLVMTQPNKQEKDMARGVFAGSTTDPHASEVLARTPEMILHVTSLLDAYDYKVVKHAQQMRNYVTNRLLMESSDKNPSIRIRALELLGKISDVGLFSDKSEVTVKSGQAGEVESRLRQKLEKLMGKADVVDAVVVK